MNKTIKFTLICVLCICTLVPTIYLLCGQLHKKQEVYISGIIPLRTEEELILDADLIMEGTVSRILDSKWSNENFYRGDNISNILQTDIEIKADNIISGQCSSNTVKVRIDKGEDKNTIVYSDGYPDFSCGEKVLLFLSRDDSDTATDEDYYVLTGMIQGKYVLSQASKGMTSQDNKVYKNTFNGEKSINISNIKADIDRIKKENPDYAEKKAKQQQIVINENKKSFGE